MQSALCKYDNILQTSNIAQHTRYHSCDILKRID